MPEPTATAIISTVASTVTSSLTLARFIADIKNTPTDVKTCFDLTHRIEDDLQTLINLRAKHEKYLLTVPDTLKRLDRIIYATKDSILDVCRLLEGCRKEVYEGNTIPLGSKMKWVLGENVAFARRTANLQQQHAALNVEIVCLRQIDVLKPLERIATTTFENVELLSMERRKVQRRESRFEIDGGQFTPPGFGVSPVASSTVLPSSPPQPVHRDYRVISNNSSHTISTASESKMNESTKMNEETKIDEEKSTGLEKSAEEDAESAFYRDLRRQEEERRRRLAAKRRLG